MKITIYTDGACSGNPGAGGWGAILMYKNLYKEISGAEAQTTNNRMELLAVIKALSALKWKCCNATVYSDSAYVVNAINQRWIDNWMNNGWRTSNKKPVLNADLWAQLVRLLNDNFVTFVKVKGHSDNKYNNKCDELAREAIKTIKEV